MRGFNQIAFGIVIGITAAVVFIPNAPPPADVPYVDPLPPQETAPVVDLVPAHEAKAEPAIGVPETAEAAQADSGVESSPNAIPPESVPSLKDAIRAYRDSYGVRWFVYGQTEQQHLVQTHGWKPEQLVGLTEDELHLLHGASHTGRLNPADFAAVQPGVADKGAAAPGDSRPKITIHMAPFHCPACNTMKGYDWSGFDVTWETGGARKGYPEASWTDKRGWRRSTSGLHTPEQVRRVWEQTQ